jgi:PAS domain S-box-containing protein
MENHSCVLLVDNNKSTLQTIVNSLEQLGYVVLLSETALNAIEIVKQNDKIDIVIINFDLDDDMDGVDCAKSILEVKNLPIIFIGSYVEKELFDKLEGTISYGFIFRNSSISIFLYTIKNALRMFYESKYSHEKTEALEKVNSELININEQLHISNLRLKQSEAELNLNKNKYRILYQNAPVGFILSDKYSNILDMNKMAIEVLGYKKDELIGMNARELIHPEDLKLVPIATTLSKSDSEGSFNLKRRYKTASGKYISVDVTISFIPEVGLHHVMFQKSFDNCE